MSLTSIKTVIWDLDNTLYPYTERQIEHWHEVSVRAAIDMGVRVTFEEGLRMARQSFAAHNFSAHIFREQYSLCHKAMHERMTARVKEDILPVCHITPQAFEKLPHIRHVIVTHAHKDWAERVLKHLGLRGYFETDAILGLEDYGFQHKHESNDGILRALDYAGGAAQDTVFAEDTLKNLAKAKEEGVHTAYIHHGNVQFENDNRPDYVDYQFAKAYELLYSLTQGEFYAK